MSPELKEKNADVQIQYGLMNALFKNYELDLKTDIELSKYPYSNRAVYNGIKKMDLVIEKLISCDSFYVSNVLTRVLFEHYIVTYYIAVKSQLEFSDSVGRQYYNEYRYADHLKRLSYDLKVERISQDQPAPQFLDLQARYDEYAKLSVQEKDKLMEVWNSFYRIDNIIKYLLHNEKQDKDSRLYHEQLPILLNIYNVTSSYVHGGAIAEFETFEMDGHYRDNRIESFIMFGKIVVYSLKLRLMSSLIPRNRMYSKAVLPIEYFILKQFFRFNYTNPI